MTQLDARGARTVAAMNPMMPVSHSNGELLEGSWTGTELNDYRVVNGTFCGSHYLLQLGYILDPGDPQARVFRVRFIVHYPLRLMTHTTEELEEANRCARAMIGMLNLRRKEFA